MSVAKSRGVLAERYLSFWISFQNLSLWTADPLGGAYNAPPPPPPPLPTSIKAHLAWESRIGFQCVLSFWQTYSGTKLETHWVYNFQDVVNPRYNLHRVSRERLHLKPRNLNDNQKHASHNYDCDVNEGMVHYARRNLHNTLLTKRHAVTDETTDMRINWIADWGRRQPTKPRQEWKRRVSPGRVMSFYSRVACRVLRGSSPDGKEAVRPTWKANALVAEPPTSHKGPATPDAFRKPKRRVFGTSTK